MVCLVMLLQGAGCAAVPLQVLPVGTWLGEQLHVITVHQAKESLIAQLSLEFISI